MAYILVGTAPMSEHYREDVELKSAIYFDHLERVREGDLGFT